MRLFVALTPPAAALSALEATVAPLRADWPGLRWTSMDRWHVTLAFLGEVAEPRLADLEVRLERAARRHTCQNLLIGPGSAFPAPSRARVLITRVEAAAGTVTHLEALAGSVAAAARRAGAPSPDENRRYRPHLTLARCRQPADVTELVQALPGPAGEPWAATVIHLIKSENGPRPSYQTLGSWPLAT
jgi:2'-5' RNA ligase